MVNVQKPSVFLVGKKKTNAPAEHAMTKEKMEQSVQNAEKFLRTKRK